MSRIRILTIVVILVYATMCGAVSASATGSSPDSSSVDRRVEVLIRSQFSVPPGYDIELGERTKSDIPGYDTLPVSFIHAGKRTTATFLLSQDCNKLARLETFDISKDPSLAIDVAGRPIRGDAAAKVEIINFDDLECPYCARLNNELSTETLNRYKGLIKIVYKAFPLDGHRWATHAAVDANCLADVDAPAYWNYVDFIHSHRQDISGAQLDPARSFVALDNIAATMATQNKVDGPSLRLA